MPYKIQSAGGKHKVVKRSTGEVMGEHDDEDGAKKQMAALYANVKKALDVRRLVPICKTVEDRREVYGFVKIAKVGGQLVPDWENDVVDVDTLAAAASDYLASSRATTLAHRQSQAAVPIESVMLTVEKYIAFGVPEEVAKGLPEGWWMGFHVNDDAIWGDVRSGKLKAFSIGGKAIREEVAA